MRCSVPSLLLCGVLGLLGLAPPSGAGAPDKTAAPPGSAVNVTVTAGTVPAPPVSIVLHDRHGHVTPIKGKCAHTGGGLIDITSPSPDTVIVTMSGAVVANAQMRFDLDQFFEVSFDNPKVKQAKLTVEARVLGLLRGETMGCADYNDACASIRVAGGELLTLCVPPHSACGCDSLGVNDHTGPQSVRVLPGKYLLHQTFHIAALSKCCVFKRPSAEFAPDPALDPLWINYFEPFHGVPKKDFGFQVVLKVAPEEANGK